MPRPRHLQRRNKQHVNSFSLILKPQHFLLAHDQHCKISQMLPLKTSHSASQPGLVTDLQSLPTGPITKIASGGYVTAALTAGQDLYLWGADEFLRLGRQPTPLDLGDVDVRDVAVGDGHVVIATLDGKVLITGKGENGQIGMGEGIEELVEWREVDLNLGSESKILQVAAGPRCSLLLVGTGSKLAPRSLV